MTLLFGEPMMMPPPTLNASEPAMSPTDLVSSPVPLDPKGLVEAAVSVEPHQQDRPLPIAAGNHQLAAARLHADRSRHERPRRRRQRALEDATPSKAAIQSAACQLASDNDLRNALAGTRLPGNNKFPSTSRNGAVCV